MFREGHGQLTRGTRTLWLSFLILSGFFWASRKHHPPPWPVGSPYYPHTLLLVMSLCVWIKSKLSSLLVLMNCKWQSGATAENLRPSKKRTEGERADRGTIMRGEARTPHNLILKEQNTNVCQNQQRGWGGGWKTEAARSAEFLL